MTLLRFAQSLIYAPSLWNIVLLILLYHILGFNAYHNGMGASLIAFLDTHRSISRYVASLLAQKSHSSRREQNASLIARSSSFFLLAQETTAFAHLLGVLCPRACGPAVELGIPIPSDQR